MPRHARLDAPVSLHHIIIRGIERSRIVFDYSLQLDFEYLKLWHIMPDNIEQINIALNRNVSYYSTTGFF